MLEVIIGIICCLGMMGLLAGYLKYTKKKYYNGKDQSSLSNTFYHTGWKFRVLLILLGVILIYPIMLADGIYGESGWLYYAPYTLISWSKFMFALCIGGIFGVALNADFNKKTESVTHVVAAVAIAGACGLAGCLLRKEWYICLGIWIAWLIYYLIKNYINNKKGNPNALALYMELVCFYSVPTCLICLILMNFLFLTL